jgi:hypothetical protein
VSDILVAVESFAGSNPDGTSVSVPRGMRLRADHPLVKRAPWAFLPDGSGEEAAVARRLELQQKAEAAVPVIKPETETIQPRPVKPQDRMICIKGCGLLGADAATVSRSGEPMGCRRGDIISKNTRLYRENRSHFIAVVPPGLQREDAVVALTELSHNGKVVAYVGQWLHREDPMVALQWQHFAPAPLDL